MAIRSEYIAIEDVYQMDKLKCHQIFLVDLN